MIRFAAFFVALHLLFFSSVHNSQAGADYEAEHKHAIVLAMFGTTVEPALDGLLNIRSRLMEQYPHTPVRIAFTSNIIRKKWQQRAQDPDYIKTHPEILPEILHVKTPLATIADLQNEGFDSIVLQPTHISMGEEFLDLQTYVDALMRMGTVKKEKYKPFHTIALGRPAMGTYGTGHPYGKDLERIVQVLAPDVQLAKKEQAGLVYMGHGNEYFPGSGGAYLELAAKMREMYPDVVTAIGCVEGFPGIAEVMETLKLRQVQKVVLKPFMVVAGDHTINDMSGEDEDSWQSILQKNGFEVISVNEGLGENKDFAGIFVENAIDAAEDAGIKLN
ncbi:MAG: sirohydrochlorin cobaltochelatase [bacterium]|nr:sirohydrochlorin cobaltochelatase [bacterium]